MKKILLIPLAAVSLFALMACSQTKTTSSSSSSSSTKTSQSSTTSSASSSASSSVSVASTADFNETDFEAALNAGQDLTGKTVTITVQAVVPSGSGFNIQAGQHLNFLSSTDPGVSAGANLTVRVKQVSPLGGSFLIDYDRVS